MTIAQDTMSLIYSDISNEMTVLNAIAASTHNTGVNRKYLIDRYLKSNICREVCSLYPCKATSGKWIIGVPGDEPIENEIATNLMRSLFAQKIFRTAQTVANIIGSSILIIDDGLDSVMPVTLPIALHLMLPEQLVSGIAKDGFYESADSSQLIHESRVLIFHGIENPFNLKGWGYSRMVGFLDSYTPYRTAVNTIAKELKDRSIFTLKKTGLDKQLAIQEQRSILKSFFQTLRQGLDTLGILAIDKDLMEVEWKERTFTDIDVPLSELRRNTIADADIPEMELFGVQDNNGMAEKGLADRLIVARKAVELQAEWEPNLIRLKNAIDPNPSTEIILPDPLQLSPVERAEVNLKNAQAEKERALADKAIAETESLRTNQSTISDQN